MRNGVIRIIFYVFKKYMQHVFKNLVYLRCLTFTTENISPQLTQAGDLVQGLINIEKVSLSHLFEARPVFRKRKAKQILLYECLMRPPPGARVCSMHNEELSSYPCEVQRLSHVQIQTPSISATFAETCRGHLRAKHILLLCRSRVSYFDGL